MAKKKPNYLSSAEIDAESNYNAVGDGLINGTKKSSMLERLDKYEQRKKERHKDDLLDRKLERHREARHEQDER